MSSAEMWLGNWWRQLPNHYVGSNLWLGSPNEKCGLSGNGPAMTALSNLAKFPATTLWCCLNSRRKFRGRQLNFAGALSVAEKPIESRLKTILEPMTQRSIPKLGFRTAVALLFGMLVFTVSTVRPFNEPETIAIEPNPVASPDQDNEKPNNKDPKDELVALPDEVTGRIVDDKGKPIEGATADVHIEPYYRFNIPGEGQRN